MRQIIASAVIAAFVCTAASPVLPQRPTSKTRIVGRPTAVRQPPTPIGVGASRGSFADFEKIEAVTDGNGALIRWSMRQESGVAAYQVYRIDMKGGRVAIGRPVLGSAAKTRASFMYGEEYSAFDPDGSSNSTYEIEALSVAGAGRITTGQFSAGYQRSASLAIQTAQYTADAGATSGVVETVSPTSADLKAPAADPVNQKWVAAQPGAKIAVKKEGLYRVTRAELQAAGFNLATNSANWRLFADGTEQAMLVGPSDQYIEFYGKGIDTNESDTRIYYLIADITAGLRMTNRAFRSSNGTPVAGSFSATVEKKERINYLDSVFNGDGNNFFGNLVTSSSYNSKVTLANVDTASIEDATLNILIQGYSSTNHDMTVSINGHSLAGQGDITGSYSSSFSKTYTVPSAWLVEGSNSIVLTSTSSGDYSLFDTARLTYTQKFRASQNQATIFTPGRRKVSLMGFGAPTTSTVTVQAATVAQPTASSATPTTVASNTPGVLRMSAPTYTAGTGGTAIARLTVSRVYGSTGTVGATLTLADGTATGGSSCGAGVDYVFPASNTVTLADGITAKDVDVQLCSGNIADPNGETFTAALSSPTGGATLASSNIRAFDLTYSAPQTISGLTAVQNGSDLGVIIPVYRSSTFYALDDAYALQAASVTGNTPSTLSTTSNAADMVIIYYPSADLTAAAQSWAAYRQSANGGSMNVKLVNVDDIYDEFSYGSQSSNAIKAFLNYAYSNWPGSLKYTLLIGDATYDPRNYEGRVAPTHRIPTKMVDLIYAESGSDEALADFNGDGLAEIPIGRIPVTDGATANLILNKTIAQETAAMQSFSRGAVFANDAPIGYDFASMNQTLRNDIPGITNATFVARGDATNTQFPTSLADLVNALNTGPYIVNYAGHGASGLWGSSSWFTINTVPSLTNPNQSIYTMLTCLNGYFLRTNADSLAETLLKSTGGGASLAWASTTETTPDVQLIMGDQFYKQLNAGNIKRVGDLIKDAKAQIPGSSDVRYSWVLLGDPATKVRP